MVFINGSRRNYRIFKNVLFITTKFVHHNELFNYHEKRRKS